MVDVDAVVDDGDHDRLVAPGPAPRHESFSTSSCPSCPSNVARLSTAEQGAIRQIKDQAVSVAVAAAGDVLRDRMKAADANKLIDAAISEVGDKLH